MAAQLFPSSIFSYNLKQKSNRSAQWNYRVNSTNSPKSKTQTSTWKLWGMKTFPGTDSNEKKLQRFLLKSFFLNLNLVVTNEPSRENAENSSSSPINYLNSVYKLCLFVHCFWCTEEEGNLKKPEMVRTTANQCGIYSGMNNMQWWTETMSAKVPHLCQELNFQLLVTVTFSGCNFRKSFASYL